MSMSDVTFVRVADEFGNEFSQSDQTPLQPGCTLLDKPAADHNGHPYPWKPKVNLQSADTAALKGQALADALEAAGLPATGTADEKRQALADHQAAEEAIASGQTITTEEETS